MVRTAGDQRVPGRVPGAPRRDHRRCRARSMQAEQELTQATVELANYNSTPPLADGFYALGEIRLRMGDLAGAEEALRQAHALGRSPHPALALIRLREGKVGGASRRSTRPSPRRPTDLWHRARLLAGAGRDRAGGGRRRDRRVGRRTSWRRSPRTTSRRRCTRPGTTRWGGRSWRRATPRRAARELRTAIRHWRDVGAPYEIAPDRVALASALRPARERRRGRPGARGRAGGVRAARGGARRRGGGRSVATGRPRPARGAGRRRGRRSCSRTSWAPRAWPRRWATRPGSTCCGGTTTRCGRCSRRSAARW